MSSSVPWKLCMIAVVARFRGGKVQIEIHERINNSQYPQYDQLYAGTWEVCGERMEEKETLTEAAVRAVVEEFGCQASEILKIIGLDDQTTHTTRPGQDRIVAVAPRCFSQQMQGPQPWAGFGVIAQVKPETEPYGNAQGEVGQRRWVEVTELQEELIAHPENFMGLHYPVLLWACRELLDFGL